MAKATQALEAMSNRAFAMCAPERYPILVIVQLYQLLEKISEHSGTWQLSEDREAWHASDVQLALAWYEQGEHTTVIKR